MVAASAALTISGVPFMGPIGSRVSATRMANISSTRRLDEVKTGELDLVVAATHDAVMMVEIRSQGAFGRGHARRGHVSPTRPRSRSSTRSSSSPKRPRRIRGSSNITDNTADMKAELKKLIGADIAAAYKLTDKSERSDARSTKRAPRPRRPSRRPARQTTMVANKLIKKLEAEIVRTAILKDGARIDGRERPRTVRPIEAMVRLPAAHPRLGAVHPRRDRRRSAPPRSAPRTPSR